MNTTDTTILAVTETGLASGTLWGNIWTIGAVVCCAVAVYAGYVSSGVVLGALSLLWRIPLMLVGWSVVCLFLMACGWILEMVSQTHEDRHGSAAPETVACSTVDPGCPESDTTEPDAAPVV